MEAYRGEYRTGTGDLPESFRDALFFYNLTDLNR